MVVFFFSEFVFCCRVPKGGVFKGGVTGEP